MTTSYEPEILGPDEDDGQIVDSKQELADLVVGHRIVSAEQSKTQDRWGRPRDALILTLSNGKRVILRDTDDCCAYTEVERFVLNADKIDHAITGVGTTEGYTKWHIFADQGDVLTLDVGWSAGNPFYYGYGFDIAVEDVEVAS